MDLTMKSYRQTMGLDNPPPGTGLNLEHMAGMKFYLHWPDCPDGEDIVHGWINTRQEAEKFAAKNKWIILNKTVNMEKSKVDVAAIMERAKQKTQAVKSSTEKIADKKEAFRIVPNFSLYEFNGNIIRNVKTKHPISPKTGRTKYQIKDDKGVSHNLNKEEIKALFPAEVTKPKAAAKVKAPKAPKEPRVKKEKVVKVPKVKVETPEGEKREFKYHHVPQPMALDKLKPDAKKIMSFPSKSYDQVIALHQAGYSKAEIIEITGRRNDVVSKYLRPLLKGKK